MKKHSLAMREVPDAVYAYLRMGEDAARASGLIDLVRSSTKSVEEKFWKLVDAKQK
jgi:hypothetical protein